ncbi:MAG: hypothetical protein GKS07_06720 [Nitrosopumilus sp.]|nr:MAG: hypothetical protein GKS07_06720 [Nitrosopumilus sp.]
MTSSDDMSEMFDNESQKLQIMIDTANSKPNLNIYEIVETYYQVMNVSSMSTMLSESVETESKLLLNKIHKSEKLISEQFNSITHPQIMETLSDSILADTKKLQSAGSGKKSKEEIESDAKLFENLRQKMSILEFVEQYDKSLHHD